ncbi:MAG: hypothetical protein HKN29_15270 [Rhodothermales bacterium]|nr:hypothetical protein [Rhodothermales bacterium]
MPEEVFVIVVVAIVMGTITSMTKMILAYRERTRGFAPQQESAGSSSVTTSELERMMHRAARKATDPLLDRIEELEDRLDTPALPEKGERIDLDAAIEGQSTPAMAPRRTRNR